MRHSIFGLFVASILCGTAVAETTIGIGLGSLYNGIGFNIGRTSSAGMTFGSIGCMSPSASTDSNESGERNSTNETNCGVGVGFINTSFLPGNNHGLGLSLGYTHNTDEVLGGDEIHAMSGYHYFLNGIGQKGVNLGFSALVTQNEERTNDTGLLFNIGYQF